MQLSFDLSGPSPLEEARGRLRGLFRTERDGPRRDPVSQLVLSLVSSKTLDAVSAAAFKRLRARYGSWEVLARANPDEVAEFLQGVTWPEGKAPQIVGALRAIELQAGAISLDFLADLPVDAALAWLERLDGVARKIAASVVNFSTLRGYAFVMDTHVLRVAQRLGWVSPRVKSAEKAYDQLIALVPPSWDADDLYEMHWLMKRLGQGLCRHSQTECARCPLLAMCARIGVGGSAPDPTPPREEARDAPEASEDEASNDNSLSLRDKIARLERGEFKSESGVAPFGDARIDACFPAGGLSLGRLHEIGGEGSERETPAAPTGFAAHLAARTARDGAILWALQRDDLYAPGLASFGINPDRLIFVQTAKDDETLSVVEDALRTRGIAAVVGEIAGLDLTASRRLQLACERGGATAFALRRRLYGTPRIRQKPSEISCASTRWRITPAQSVTNEPGLGPPRWKAVLERCRGGRAGAWIMESENATGDVRVVAELADHALEARAQGRSEALGAAGLRHHDHGGERAASGGG